VELKSEIENGVRAALEDYPFQQESSALIAAAIEEAAVYDDSGAQVVSLDPEDDVVLRYDVRKGIFAAIGILGSVASFLAAPIAPPAAIAGILSSLGALGSLQGLRQPLSQDSGRIIFSLLKADGHVMERASLQVEFMVATPGPREELLARFVTALDRLQDIGTIRADSQEGSVRLVERVLVRR